MISRKIFLKKGKKINHDFVEKKLHYDNMMHMNWTIIISIYMYMQTML